MYPLRIFPISCTPVWVLLAAALLMAAAGLSGCSQSPVVMQNGQPDTLMQQRLRTVSGWHIEGKLAMRSSQTSQSARMQWRQNNENFDIHLSGPAGLRATRIHGEHGNVFFEQGSRKEQADTAEALSEKLIGWPLPAADLGYWLRGLPSPRLPLVRTDYQQDGSLAYLQQHDWQIQFSDYRRVDENGSHTPLALPGRIEATRDDLVIILLIKRWDEVR